MTRPVHVQRSHDAGEDSLSKAPTQTSAGGAPSGVRPESMDQAYFSPP